MSFRGIFDLPFSPAMQAFPKIALIGCNNVAAQSAYSLLNGSTDIELALFGDFGPELLRSVKDLFAQTPIRTRSRIYLGEPGDIEKAQICVLSSGLPPCTDDTDDSFILRNIRVVRRDAAFLKENSFTGILIVTTSPAEVMAQIAMDASGSPAARVIGLGPNVAAGFETALAGKVPVTTWCSASGCSTEFIDSCHPDCPYFEEMLERFHRFQKVPNRRASSTMANCVMRICEAILRDERAALPIVALLSGEHGIAGTFVNVPCIIGSNGIELILELQLSLAERSKMLDSARNTGWLYNRLAQQVLVATHGGPN